MTLERITKYQAKLAELRVCQEQLRQLRAAAPKTKDVVQSSWKRHPYIKGTSVVEGMTPADARTITEAARILISECTRIKEELRGIKQFVASVKDAKVRALLQAKYIMGKSWAQTAVMVYGYPGAADRARKAVARYFNK